MLEVKNLTKAYKNKKGVVTKALDGVSLNFPERGMVFILGKSGSGKSTLLNICGGLDKADSGEIIIKGKSSNEFSGLDFDSYRNTYVGFVFQEYNILDEFTVEENIGMALELQNKKRDKASIDKLLEEVDMSNFASRKPNTLSGGQKQRVAIARALVKAPEIIMADEPTGALDSKTGQQVFDTLKKLSKDKLVLVISHDRDFAEQYADRIIELKDGRILSDQIRSMDDDNVKNVRYYSTDTVCVTNGAEITDEDLQNIKKFLQRNGGSAVISTSRAQITKMKEDRPEISVGSFDDIKEQPKPKTYENQKLIRSHLPLKHAIKMGANSLKTKPVRLFFTLFLSIIAFILFGLASTLMLFDGKSVTVQTFVDSEDEYMMLSKAFYGRFVQYKNDELEYTSDTEDKQQTKYTLEEYKKIDEKYPGTLAISNCYYRLGNVRLGRYAGQYYTDTVNKVILVNKNIELLHGVYPTATDEIAISQYLYDGIALAETTLINSNDKEISITKPEDLLYTETNNVTLNVGYNNFKVVGIYKIGTLNPEFNALKQAADSDTKYFGENSVLEQWDTYLRGSLLSSIMVNESYLKANKGSNLDVQLPSAKYFNFDSGALRIWFEVEEQWQQGYITGVSKRDRKNLLNLYDFNGNKVETLPNQSAALHINRAARLYADAYSNYYNEVINSHEEQERIENIWASERLQFEKEHLLIDKYFDAAAFEQAKINWETDFQFYKTEAENGGMTFDETAYRETHPYPQKEDINDYGYGYEYSYYKPDEAYNAAFNDYYELIHQTSGTLSAYKTLLYNARKKADEEFRKTNPEPILPENPTGAQLDEYNKLYETWSSAYWRYVNDAVYAANPVYQLSILGNYSLTKEEILGLFRQAEELFDGFKVQVGIENKYNTEFNPITISGLFFDPISEDCAYLSDDLYEQYYDQDMYSYTYWSDFVTKYKEPEDAIIESVYIPYEHSNEAVQELVDRTYSRADDDSTCMILNEEMNQLSMFIDLAGTLGTAFLIAGLVLALFAFLLMFNFISASITAKKKEIGILRAIGARTFDVFKIFMSESMIIALICLVISVIGTFGLCVMLNKVLTEGTFIVISIFSFGPLSALCILGVALLTAIVSTVIPVALYSRKPPIESIRAL